jgi:hypothetical protein
MERRFVALLTLLIAVALAPACGSVGGKTDAGGTGGSAGAGGGTGGAGGGDGGAGATSDAAVDQGSSVDSGPWTPAQLSGLALWLSADTGVVANNNRVTTWNDQSSHNNNAAQNTTARQPMLVAGVINGKPVVRFDGSMTGLQVTDSSSLQWGTDDFTVEVVASFTNSTTVGQGYGLIFSKQLDTTSPFPGPSLWANYPITGDGGTTIVPILGVQLQGGAGFFATSPVATALNDGNPRLLGGRRVGGTNIEARINGAQVGTAVSPSAIDISATGFPLFMGAQITTSNAVVQALKGDIAEVVAVHGAITTADLMQLESYLRTKYGL